MDVENTNTTGSDSNQIVSCSGSGCDFCSLLEALSNLYNFFLLVSFAVAVLALVYTGLNYILNQSNREKAKQNFSQVKKIALGFSIVILGWLAINVTFRVLGYTNAGSWYKIECNLPQENVSSGKTNFGSAYDNLETFPELKDFLSSGLSSAKITGPDLAPLIQKQLELLGSDEILHILAPTRLNTVNGFEDIFLPLLTVKKENNELGIESLGEYVDLLGNGYPESGLKDSLLNQLLGKESETDNRSFLSADGDEMDSKEFQDLYRQVSNLLKGSSSGQDNEEQDSQNLSDLLLSVAGDDNQNETGRIISLLTAETLKTLGVLSVEKEYLGNILTDSKNNCLLSGGEWAKSNCLCPEDKILSGQTCKDREVTQNGCTESGGKWVKVGSGFPLSSVCGMDFPLLESDFERGRADLDEVVGDQYHCSCPDGFCVDTNNVCQKINQDSDNDGISNEEDKCPETTEGVDEINTKPESQYYGCSCSDLGHLSKECPPDQCVGDYFVTYPEEEKDCQNGQPKAYSCKPKTRVFDEKCTGVSNQNLNNNSSQKAPSNNSNKNSGGSSGSGTPGTLGKIADDFGNAKKAKDIGENKIGPGGGNAMYSKPEGVKAALRRIHERDPLRYEMIFRYVKTLAPTAFSGGLCYGCGYVEVNYGLPLKMLDQVIVHESTHSGHFCRGMGETTAEVERIAVGNEIGSMEREKKDDKGRDIHFPMDEFPKQSLAIDFSGMSVRGYLSRFMSEVSPKGDLIPNDYAWAIGYALSYGDNTKGPYHYGWSKKGYLLGLKEKEEKRVRQIMSMEDFPCRSKPPSDLPPVPACENAKNELKLGGK